MYYVLCQKGFVKNKNKTSEIKGYITPINVGVRLRSSLKCLFTSFTIAPHLPFISILNRFYFLTYICVYDTVSFSSYISKLLN